MQVTYHSCLPFKTKGTGLRLSLAYDIVTKGHGAALEVVSTEGVGSEFIVLLNT